MQDNPNLRVALLVDSFTVSKYVRDLITWVQEQPDIVLSNIIIHPDRFPTPRKFLNGRAISLYFSRLLFEAIIRWESLLLLIGYRAYRDHFKTYDIRDLQTNADVAYPNESAKDLGIDLLIDCGSGAFPSDTLNGARVAIIALQYGNKASNRSGLPGFWECYYHQDATEFSIVRWTEGSGTIDVMQEGRLSTQYLYSLNQAHLYTKLHQHLKTSLKKLATGDPLNAVRTQPKGYPASPYRVPSWSCIIFYFVKSSYRLSAKFCRTMLRMKQRWNIFILGENWEKAAYWKGSAMRPPRGRYWADPFLYKRGDQIFCFVEEFRFATRRGHIAALEIRGGNVIQCTPVLIEDFHLSFPFIFEYEGTTFMSPECSEAREVRVYRCVEFPRKWELAKVVMRDVCAVDPMIFQRNGKWWMFTNIDESKTDDYSADLHLFYADSPIEENWKPHPQNPIKVNYEGGRNAGLIIEKDRIFRVGQRQGFDLYGKGISIYEVGLLTEDAYAETLVWEIDPDFRDGLLGVHHLSSIGEITAIDHVKWAFVG